jgi:hypothetical protein
MSSALEVIVSAAHRNARGWQVREPAQRVCCDGGGGGGGGGVRMGAASERTASHAHELPGHTQHVHPRGCGDAAVGGPLGTQTRLGIRPREVVGEEQLEEVRLPLALSDGPHGEVCEHVERPAPAEVAARDERDAVGPREVLREERDTEGLLRDDDREEPASTV